MDDVQKLILESGCTEEQARMVLAAAGGNVERALRVVSSLAKTNIAVKGRFRGLNIDMHGLIYLICDTRSRSVDRILALVSGDASLVSRVDLSLEWKKFEESILSARMGGNIAQQTTQELQNFLIGRFRGELGENLVSLAERGAQAEMRSALSLEIGKSIADGEVKIELRLDPISELDVKGPKIEEPKETNKEKDEPEEADEADLSPGDVTILVNAILAPVSGRPAGQLVPGDQVLVKLVNPEDGTRLMRLFPGASMPQGSNPFPMEVITVSPGEFEKVQVVGRIAAGVMGISSVSAELKIKTEKHHAQQPVFSGPLSSEEIEFRPSPTTNSLFPFIMGVGVFLFLFFLLYLFLGF